MTRILTIEDDADLQHLLGQLLGSAGYDVHYAFTGPEGYEKAFTLAPDLIICDMMLPGPRRTRVDRQAQEELTRIVRRLLDRPATRPPPAPQPRKGRLRADPAFRTV